MKRFAPLLSLFVAAFWIAACGDKDAPSPVAGNTPSNPKPADPADEHEGHDDHADHGEHDDHDHGERRSIGASEVGGFKIAVALFGTIESGGEAVLDIEVAGPTHTAVRAWVGIESGAGSLKARIDGESGDYHGHVEVPATLPADSAIWIEIEAADGARHRASFKYT